MPVNLLKYIHFFCSRTVPEQFRLSFTQFGTVLHKGKKRKGNEKKEHRPEQNKLTAALS